jgi:hypothetical protein
MRSMPDEPYGLLVFRIVDSETQAEMDSIDILQLVSSDKYSRPLRDWHAQWRRPGDYSFKFVRDGYMSIVVEDIRVPIDAATILTLQMKKGENDVPDRPAGDSLVSVVMASLDEVFPKNEITGGVLDASNGLPVSDASVYCEETRQTVSTDSLGQFHIGLNIRKSATLDVWHPLYDSIRFDVTKKYIRTPKEILIYFESLRRDIDGKPMNDRGDSAVLLLVDMKGWSSFPHQPRESINRIYTYAVLPGDIFGPTWEWVYNDCVPFRLIKGLPDESAWIQFSEQFRLISESMRSKTNFLFLADSAILLSTKTMDAGTTVSLSLQPDYSPRGLVGLRATGPAKRQSIPDEKKGADSCDVIKAQVERVHICNILALLNADFAHLAKACSHSFKPRDNKLNLPLEEFFRLASEDEFPDRFSDKRLLEIFKLRSEEMYVHEICAEPVNEGFLRKCEQNGFEPQRGDVYIYWPGAAWSGGMSAVYRNEDDEWKIVEIL